MDDLLVDEELFYSTEEYKLVEKEFSLSPLTEEIADLAQKANSKYNKLNIENWLTISLKYSDDQVLKRYYQKGSQGSEIEFEATFETGGERIFIEFFGTNSEFREELRQKWESISKIAKIT